jgi:membrane peptidoglycan carboxypeptidase
MRRIGQRSAFADICGLIAAAVTAGLVVAALVLPGVGGIGLAAKKAANEVRAVAFNEPPLPQRSTIQADNGTTIGTFYYQNRVDVTFGQIAPVMRQAMVSIEDSRFWTNGPLDLKATLRALVHNSDAGSSGQLQGGSTITQQYVKNVLEVTAVDDYTLATEQYGAAHTAAQRAVAKTAENNALAEENAAIAPDVNRKITELRYAIWVEDHNSKRQILADYLNAIYLGGYQVYGVEAAAEYYFGEPARRLTLPQAAMLAGMANNANLYDPVRYPTNTTDRRNTVLARMAQLGEITWARADAAMKKPLGLHLTPEPGNCTSSAYPFFCTYVQDEILNDPTFGKTLLDRETFLDAGGLTIHSTLNIKAQRAAQRAMNALAPRRAAHIGMEVMVHPGTGAVEAIALSRPYGFGAGDTTIDFAVDEAHGGGAGVQAGSTFKLFTLVTALEQGYNTGQTFATPATIDLGGFRKCDGDSAGSWQVSNAEPSDGATNTLLTGTWKSVNTYFAQLEQAVGLCNVAHTAVKLGMINPNGLPLDQENPWPRLDNQIPSFTLGANDIDILHEDAAYAAMAVSGRYCSPVAMTSMTDGRSRRMKVPSANCHQAVPRNVANEVAAILRGVLSVGTAAGNELPGRDAAGKTGTTNGEAQALFVGFTPNLSAEVWYGDPAGPEGDPAGQFGSYTAPFWRQSMEQALAGLPAPSFPGAGGNFNPLPVLPTSSSPGFGPTPGPVRTRPTRTRPTIPVPTLPTVAPPASP